PISTRPTPRSLPGLAGAKNWTFRLRVGANSPAASWQASAGPMVSSSIADRKPPWMLPAGLVNSGLPSNSASRVPAAASTLRIVMPSVRAAAGWGSLPSWICQKNAFGSIESPVVGVRGRKRPAATRCEPTCAGFGLASRGAMRETRLRIRPPAAGAPLGGRLSPVVGAIVRPVGGSAIIRAPLTQPADCFFSRPYVDHDAQGPVAARRPGSGPRSRLCRSQSDPGAGRTEPLHDLSDRDALRELRQAFGAPVGPLAGQPSRPTLLLPAAGSGAHRADHHQGDLGSARLRHEAGVPLPAALRHDRRIPGLSAGQARHGE